MKTKFHSSHIFFIHFWTTFKLLEFLLLVFSLVSGLFASYWKLNNNIEYSNDDDDINDNNGNNNYY